VFSPYPCLPYFPHASIDWCLGAVSLDRVLARTGIEIAYRTQPVWAPAQPREDRPHTFLTFSLEGCLYACSAIRMDWDVRGSFFHSFMLCLLLERFLQLETNLYLSYVGRGTGREMLMNERMDRLKEAAQSEGVYWIQYNTVRNEAK